MNKTIALGIFVFATVVLGGMLLRGRQHDAQMSAEFAAMKAHVAEQDAELQKTRTATAELEQKRTQLAAKAKAARQSLLEARAAASSPSVSPAAVAADAGSDSADATGGKKKSANPFTDSIAKMMKDPAMKNMMRASQSTALREMYGDLVKQWSLSPDETKTFYDLLLDKQMDQMDQGMAFLDKGSTAATPAASSVVADPDAKLKASLGDDLYKQYQDYEKTIAGRVTVGQLQQQLVGNNTPALTADQSNAVIQAVTEEHVNMPPGAYPTPSGNGGNAFTMDPAQMDQMMKAQSDLNDRIDARVAGVLSADQLQAFKEQQQQMLATQRMGMEMAAKMMGPSPTP